MQFYYFIGLLVVLFALIYLVTILGFWSGWVQLIHFQPSNKPLNTSITLLVPFYNEQHSLKRCVESLLRQKIVTKSIQIILVNDKSTDDSLKIAEQLANGYPQIQVINNTTLQKGKKQALMLGMHYAKGELIVTTDADCVHAAGWLNTVVEYFETYNPKMILGPVQMESGSNWLEKFQDFEFMSLIGSTAGAAGLNRPIMSNAANMAFTRECYNELADPFKQEFISGDDMFLMHQIKDKYPNAVHFLKAETALVTISPVATIKGFLKQRFRWVSKTRGYTDADTIFTAGVVFFTILLMVVTLVGTLFYAPFFKLFLIIYCIKSIADILLLNPVFNFFNRRKLLWYLPLFQFIYIFYVSITAVSIIINKRKRLLPAG